ncbi:hypothetical protein niasHS_007693 [Heterodera schachtii]|uniref:Uncharacterized protein n=2 Tax=Heterodera TaxID=34509 RepID=A0ABD2JPT8_HETSC
MASLKKANERPKKKLSWTNVTVFLRIFRAKKDFLWKGNEIQWTGEPLAERMGILRTRKQDKVKSLKKKAIGQFAKEYKCVNLTCEAVFVGPFSGETKPLQADTHLQVEKDMEYTLILYLTDD